MTEELLQDLAQYKTHKDKSELPVVLCGPAAQSSCLYLSVVFASTFLIKGGVLQT